MKLPEEVVVTAFLPTLRSMLAQRLARADWSETSVARALGVSQAAVSKYLRRRVKVEESLARDERMKALVEELAVGFEKGTLSPFQAMAKVHSLVQSMEERGPICALHEAAFPVLQGLGCDLCARGSDDTVAEEQEVLAAVRHACRSLQALPGFADLIPNVGSNLAMAKRGATQREEVAAIPGRIFEMRGSVRVASAPEFGASRHVAELVLALHSAEPRIRAALNIRYDKAVVKALEALSHRALEIDPVYEGRGSRIRQALGSGPAPTVVYHQGGYGIEPVAYVAGEDPGSVVSAISDLLQYLSRS